jgi:hypothetical protein
MEIAIENIRKEFQPFISEIKIGLECVTVWLKKGFVYSVTSASCSTWTFSDYQDEQELIECIDDCLHCELVQITNECWEKGQHFTDQDVVNHNPAKI